MKPFVVHRPGALGDILCSLSLYQDLCGVYPSVSYAVGDVAFATLKPLADLLHIPMQLASSQNWEGVHKHNLIGYPLNPDGSNAPTHKHLTKYFADEMGVECNPVLRLAPPNVRTDRPYVTVQTTAGWSPLKNWPPVNWAELVNLLKGAGYAVVQIGGPQDVLLPNADLQFCGSPFIANLYAQAGAAGHLGPDSVFNHTAGLIEWGEDHHRIPAVILFGSTSPVEAGYPTAANIYRQLPCQPCFGHVCNAPDNHACLKSISPMEVLGVALKQFGKPVLAPVAPSLKISVVMICKNEESCILDALHSVKDADEIVVCDTGSTDSTVELVAGLGWPNIRQTSYPWDDHYANARNAALDAATGDWCLSLDCDEVVKPGTLEKLREVAATATGNTFQMRLYSKGAENNWHYLVRFFRRTPQVRWAGRGHEAINFDDQTRFEDGGIIYGYSDAHNQDPDRMMRIMLKSFVDAELAGEKPGTRTLYYMAREFWYRRNFERALFWFHERVKEMGFRAECADAWLYIARINWASGKPEEAREAALKSLVLAPDCRETLLFLAEMSFPEQAAVWNRFAGVAGNEGVLFKRA